MEICPFCGSKIYFKINSTETIRMGEFSDAKLETRQYLCGLKLEKLDGRPGWSVDVVCRNAIAYWIDDDGTIIRHSNEKKG